MVCALSTVHPHPRPQVVPRSSPIVPCLNVPPSPADWGRMATIDHTTAMVICAWCDQPTPAGAPCVACAGDPEGPFGKATGLAAVRERRMAARQAMLASRRRPTEPPPIIDGLPAGQFVPHDELPERPEADERPAADERLRAALELAPEIIDPARTETAPEVDLGDPSTWPPVPSPEAEAATLPSPASLAGLAPAEPLDERAAAKAAQRQVWATPPRGRPWGLPAGLDEPAAPPAAPGADAPTKRHRVLRIIGIVVAIGALVVVVLVAAITFLGSKKAAQPVAAPSASAAWVGFQGPHFSADFPAQPTASVSNNYVKLGVTAGAPVWQASDGHGVYYVVELPVASANGAQLASTFVADSTAASHGTLRSTSASRIGPYAVEDATLNTPGGSVVTERVMAGTSTSWALLAVYPGGAAPGWHRFLLSFDPSV